MRRRTRPLPASWKKHLEKSIRNGESPWGNNLEKCGSSFVDLVRQELANPEIQRNMLRLLGRPTVEAATEYLWKVTKDRPEVQEKVTVYIHRSLYWLANYVQPRHKERTVKEVRRIIKTLEQVRDDVFDITGNTSNISILFRGDEGFIKKLETAIESYRLDEQFSRKTNPKDRNKRAALAVLRHDFSIYFGSPMNQAVAYLMEAAFGGKWTTESVRVRASEWQV